MFDRWYDELAVGDKHTFRGVTVTETHIVNFAGVTGDNYPLHMDAEYAKSTPYQQRVAHGLLVLSLGAGLIPLREGRVTALLGMTDVRFRGPVFIGDTVHPTMELLQKTDKDGGGIVTVAEEIHNQKAEVVVSATLKVLMARRPDGD